MIKSKLVIFASFLICCNNISENTNKAKNSLIKCNQTIFNLIKDTVPFHRRKDFTNILNKKTDFNLDCNLILKKYDDSEMLIYKQLDTSIRLIKLNECYNVYFFNPHLKLIFNKISKSAYVVYAVSFHGPINTLMVGKLNDSLYVDEKIYIKDGCLKYKIKYGINSSLDSVYIIKNQFQNSTNLWESMLMTDSCFKFSHSIKNKHSHKVPSWVVGGF